MISIFSNLEIYLNKLLPRKLEEFLLCFDDRLTSKYDNDKSDHRARGPERSFVIFNDRLVRKQVEVERDRSAEIALKMADQSSGKNSETENESSVKQNLFLFRTLVDSLAAKDAEDLDHLGL